jgi:predicted dehydrogenase
MIKAGGCRWPFHAAIAADHSRQVLDLVQQRRHRRAEAGGDSVFGLDIINAGIHWLDFFVAPTQGAPVAYVMAACDASTRTYRDGMQVETLAVTYAQTGRRRAWLCRPATMQTDQRALKDTLFRLIGTQGTLDFLWLGTRYRLLNADYPQGQLVEVTPGPRSAHQRHLEHLAEQMDRDTPDYSIAEGSLLAPRNVRGGLPIRPERWGAGTAAAGGLRRCRSR